MSSHEPSMVPINCTNYPERVEADSDISGIGVLYGFFATAYLVFAFSITKSALDHLISSYEEPSPKLTGWSLAFRNTIIGFADQQVVTGISVIIAGASQIKKGFSTYHWEVVVNLAWFSSVTHLITLTALRDVIHNHRIQNNTMRLRIIGMSVLIILLVVSMYPMGFKLVNDGLASNYYLPRSIPIWCLYHPKLEWKYKTESEWYRKNVDNNVEIIKLYHTYNWAYIIFAYIVLLYGFITRVIFLGKGKWNFQPPQLLTHQLNPIRICENQMRKLTNLKHGGKHSFRRVVEYKILRTNYAIMVSSIDLYQSTLWETTWIFAALAWGTIRVFFTRDGINFLRPYFREHDEVIESQQDDWKFGQMVPVVLPVLPILTLFETLPSYSISINNLVSATRPVSKVLKLLNPFRQENFTAHVRIKTQPRMKLYQDRWYGNLLILQYFLSLMLIVRTLLYFPTGRDTAQLSSGLGVSSFIIVYLTLICMNITILFGTTLLFLGKGLRHAFRFSFQRNGIASFCAWFVLIGVLVGCMAYLDDLLPIFLPTTLVDNN